MRFWKKDVDAAATSTERLSYPSRSKPPVHGDWNHTIHPTSERRQKVSY
ncbi:MAG: hypothetical protein IMZ46_03805 [Acidobacteria bacterium]|nr:hypothetical protein [Acidobacteriota bacterium]